MHVRNNFVPLRGIFIDYQREAAVGSHHRSEELECLHPPKLTISPPAPELPPVCSDKPYIGATHKCHHNYGLPSSVLLKLVNSRSQFMFGSIVSDLALGEGSLRYTGYSKQGVVLCPPPPRRLSQRTALPCHCTVNAKSSKLSLMLFSCTISQRAWDIYRCES